jgi:benzoylsuccinyl-CoA thiolase BbsB subunit
VRKVAVIGVGMSIFGKLSERSIIDLGAEAGLAALKDAGIHPKKIEVVYCANLFHPSPCVAQEIGSKIGVVNREMINVENACAGGSTAVRETWWAIASGMYDIGLALGVDSMTTSIAKGTLLAAEDLDGELGISMPSYAALIMRRHMAEYGSTIEHFAQISVKNHLNGCLNPYSQYKKEFTLEDVLNSRMVTDPLTLFQICPYTDGAAAVVMCAADKVAQYTSKPVWMTASALKSGIYNVFQSDLVCSDASEQCAAEAYEMAGCGPEDIDLVELHDAFTANELTNSEDLGLCPRGEGGRLVDEGATEIGGRIPINPSGGLLSQGHPLSASGVRQVCEITWHLRGEAGQRQVQGAKLGLAHMEGGVVAGIQVGVCGINILKR